CHRGFRYTATRTSSSPTTLNSYVKTGMNFRKYLVLAGVTVFAVAGDSMLSHGMKQVGSISIHHLQSVFSAVVNPWVAIGILFLLGFFATYTNALSWADLTYVMPATALGYVL